ncbi:MULTISPECIES: hypothetical protein [Eubacteriales]|jgi:DNA-directed RNA polymerase specialized sigma subunit|nr:hypothetical protein [Flavonifractor plautii]MCQ5026431.1 hypothetical protein [Oscillibacter valericigenes]
MAGQQLGLPLSYSPVPIFLPWIRIPRMMSPCAEKFYFRKKGGGIIMEQTKIREQVIDDLKQYPELKKKVILLRYEQEHPAKISDSEVIDSMALSRPVSDGIRPAGFISDKTMRIATQFRDKKDRLNQETIMEIAQELYTVEQQISKLEFYVSQLEEKQAEVIRKYYFEGKTWGELQREMHLAPRTLLKRRDDGLDALVSIYSYIGQVKGDRRNT